MLSFQINYAKQATQDTKDQAENLQDRLNITLDAFERDKNKTKELIQRVKDYLMGQCSSDGAGTWSSPGGLRFSHLIS